MDNGNRRGVGIRTIVRTADEENRNLFHLWYQKRFEEEDSKARKLEVLGQGVGPRCNLNDRGQVELRWYQYSWKR
jgi:hypothetical protein